MPKTLSAGYEAHVAGTSTTLVHCVLCLREDGEVLGFTEHDRELELDRLLVAADVFDTPGDITYRPGLRAYAIKATAELAPQNTELQSGFRSDAVTIADIRAGLWDNAEIRCFRVNWSGLSDGVEKMGRKRIGKITRGLSEFTAEILGLINALDQEIVRPIGPECDNVLGDAFCQVRLLPGLWAALTAYTVRPTGDAGLGSVVRPNVYNGRHFKCTTAGMSGAAEPAWNTGLGATTADGSVVWTAIQALTVQGAITSVADPRLEFRDNTRTEAADFFGYIEFTSGANDGIGREIKAYAANGTFTPQEAFPYDVVNGDTYTAQARCRFLMSSCQAFDNHKNFGGSPFAPGNDFLFSGKTGTE